MNVVINKNLGFKQQITTQPSYDTFAWYLLEQREKDNITIDYKRLHTFCAVFGSLYYTV